MTKRTIIILLTGLGIQHKFVPSDDIDQYDDQIEILGIKDELQPHIQLPLGGGPVELAHWEDEKHEAMLYKGPTNSVAELAKQLQEFQAKFGS